MTVQFIEANEATPAASAALFSDRARRVVSRLIAKGADPEWIEVMAGEQASEISGMKADAGGWFYTGKKQFGRKAAANGEIRSKFSHRAYSRACYISAEIGDVEIMICLTQNRYGNDGKITAGRLVVGAPGYSNGHTGQLGNMISDDFNPAVVAARAALGMK